MGAVKELWEDVNYMLDVCIGMNYMSCQEIADELGCDVEFVHQIVEQRWNERIGCELQ
jgi:hypothetical protein